MTSFNFLSIAMDAHGVTRGTPERFDEVWAIAHARRLLELIRESGAPVSRVALHCRAPREWPKSGLNIWNNACTGGQQIVMEFCNLFT
jgi:hypothetical protein